MKISNIQYSSDEYCGQCKIKCRDICHIGKQGTNEQMANSIALSSPRLLQLGEKTKGIAFLTTFLFF